MSEYGVPVSTIGMGEVVESRERVKLRKIIHRTG